MDKDQVVKDLKTVKRVFKHYKVPFFLAYGTCLGAYRDKDFLPDDDDIDLGIVAEIDFKTRKDIGWILYDLGFKPQDVMFNVFGRMEPSEAGYNGNGKSGIIVCQKSIKFTIFFFREEYCETHGQEMVCVPKLGAKKLMGSPAKFYKQLGKIQFHKETFLVPNPVEDYLAWTYEDWRNPLKRDHGKLYPEIHKDNEEVYNIEGTERAIIKNQ